MWFYMSGIVKINHIDVVSYGNQIARRRHGSLSSKRTENLLIQESVLVEFEPMQVDEKHCGHAVRTIENKFNNYCEYTK